MENEPSTMPPMTNSPGSEPLTRDRLDYAMERALVLFGCYRRGDANDPDQYVASIAAVLSLYDPTLMREVTDPRSGISTTEKFSSFMPNSGELKVYCDRLSVRRARFARYAAIASPPVKRLEGPKTHLANVFIPADAPQYAAMAKRAAIQLS